ncbi:MAG TPA: SRPBCC domain-containing protein [Candidatus Limnocylindria bacterium]|nr:SRPBCC domain-containing protein [Candidatus Limnocylindria bacterium]
MDLRTTRTIRSAIEIRAPLDLVWRVLTDFDAWPAWNPHVRKVVGRPQVGRRIAIHTRPPGGRTVVMRPLILDWNPPRELRWRATFVSRRLFSGEHGFRLEETRTGQTRFGQDETFSGMLVPLYARLRLGSTRLGFAQMNEALRARAESEVAPPQSPAPIGAGA